MTWTSTRRTPSAPRITGREAKNFAYGIRLLAARGATRCRPSTRWPVASTTSATATSAADAKLDALGRVRASVATLSTAR